ncbi:MAG TPA: ABC transporter permease [Acidobacteriaceae bacterium]|jgi:predicted permease|nr:ABC transporter permease [Acidobacteriaceae bacterium]
MTLWSRAKSLGRNLFRKHAVEEDLHDEVRAFVEMATAEKVAAGWTEAEARRATLAELGGLERLKRSVREERAGTALESIAQDLRFGARQVSKSPAFGVTVMTTLALSIGITTAVFSVLYAMVIRPLPYGDVSRIVALDTHSAGGGTQFASYPEYADWRRMSHSFTALAGYLPQGTVGMESSAGPVVLREVGGTDNFFTALGVNPILGRTFLPGEETSGRGDVVVLSYEVWQQDFGGKADIVGRRVQMDGSAFTVIGVMPAGFRFPINFANSIYVPLHLDKSQLENRGNHWLQTLARLKPGVTARQAEADLDTVFAALGKADAFNAGRSVHAVDLTTWVVGNTAGSLRLLLIAVAAMLVIGCVNVAGLLLARGVKREREMALRSAIGAHRMRIVRQLLTEALLFAVCGAGAGVALAFGLLRLIRVLLIASLARGAEVQVNLPVLLAALGVSVAVTVVAALMPALRLSGTAPAMALKSGGSTGTTRGQHRLRTGFVVTQVALALALLVVSGLLLQMLGQLRSAELGFNPDQILTAEVNLPRGRYAGRDVLADFYTPMIEKLEALPGVRAAGVIQMLPLQAWGWNSEHIHIYGTAPLKSPRTDPAEVRFVSPGYYRVFQDALIEGRLQDPHIDKPTTQLVGVVNEAFVKKFIPAGRDPVGMEIGDNDQTQTLANQDNPRILIVGVVKNIRQTVYQPTFPQMDFMIAQVPAAESLNAIGSMHVVVRTAVAPASLVPAMRQVFRQVDPTVPLREPETMLEVMADVLTFERLENWLFGLFAVMAVLLAVVGLYGLLTHEVELSTREIGIRLALGATRTTILKGIYRRVGWMLAIGVGLGLVLTAAAQKAISAVVALRMQKDAWLIAALALGLLSAGLLAAALPARKASAVEPMEALREE